MPTPTYVAVLNVLSAPIMNAAMDSTSQTAVIISVCVLAERSVVPAAVTSVAKIKERIEKTILPPILNVSCSSFSVF